jgi:uncharacterized membrane protein YoaK (UPF0700 family)
MYKPRRVMLTEAERRKLRAIEMALVAEDPALSALLDGTAEAALLARRVRRRRWTYTLVSTFLFVVGALAADPGIIAFGGTLLLIAPVVLLIIGQVGPRRPPPDGRSS